MINIYKYYNLGNCSEYRSKFANPKIIVRAGCSLNYCIYKYTVCREGSAILPNGFIMSK